MATLPSSLKEKFETALENAYDEYSNDIEKGITLMEVAFDIIPDPKESYDETYTLAETLLAVQLSLKNLEEANKWLKWVMVADAERIDSGEREHWAGKLAYERGQLEDAKEFFRISNEKSEGRCWDDPAEKEYFKFFKSK